MKNPKWNLDQPGLDKKLEEFGINSETKFMIKGSIQIGFWGGSISLKSTESEDEIKVPYTQSNEEENTIPSEVHSAGLLSTQEYLLKQLAKEVHSYISDKYNIIIVDYVNS